MSNQRTQEVNNQRFLKQSVQMFSPHSSTSLDRTMKQVFWAMGSGKSTAPWMMVNTTRSMFSAPGDTVSVSLA